MNYAIKALNEFRKVETNKDSITTVYNGIKAKRVKYYRKPYSTTRDYILSKSYKELVATREEKDLIEIEFENYKVRLDSIYQSEARIAADSLLISRVLDSYLVFPEELLKENKIE